MSKGCKKETCALYKNTKYPIVSFRGNKTGDIVVVGEPPSYGDSRNGVNFSEESMDKMQSYFKSSGIDIRRVYFTNVAMCQVNKRDMPIQKERDAVVDICCSFAKTVISKLKPKVVIAMGAEALKVLTGKTGISKDNIHGKPIFSEALQVWVFPVFSLGYIARNEGKDLFVHRDFKRLRAFLDNDCQPTVDKTAKPEKNYTELQSLQEFYKGKLKGSKLVAIDTEGQGLKWYNTPYVCLGYSICAEPGSAHFITLFQEGTPEDCDFSIVSERVVPGTTKKVRTRIFVKRAPNFEKKLRELKYVMESEDIPKVMHHGSFDVHVIQAALNVGGRLLKWPSADRVLNVKGWIMDTQFAAHVMNENIFRLASLDFLQEILLDKEFPYKYNTIFGEKYDKGDMLQIQSLHHEDFIWYSAADAEISYLIAEKLIKWFNKKGNERLRTYVNEFGQATNMVLTDMEAMGVLINHAEVPAAQQALVDRQLIIKNRVIELMPPAIRERHIDNLSLTRDVVIRDCLYDKKGFGLKVLQKTKTAGEPSIDKDVRKLLMDDLVGDQLEFIQKYDEFEKLDTLRTRYLSSLAKDFGTDNLIHSSFSTCNTDTGRTCLTGDTLIYTPDSRGAVPIRDIKEGDWVYCFDDELQPQVARVGWQSKTMENASLVKITYRIPDTGEANSIRCTAWHLFRLNDGSYKAASKLESHDVLLAIYQDSIYLGEDISEGVHAELISVQELTEREDVYDINIPGYANFIANGVCVHNSSAKPNMQNLPKRGGEDAAAIRRLIIAPPGYVVMKADESQAELRWAAVLSGDETMKNVFRNDGDIHVTTGEQLAGRPWASLTDKERKDYRQNAKPVNFGLLYMMSAAGFQRYAKLEYGVEMTLQEAEKTIEIYFRTYSKLQDYHQKTIAFGMKYGYVETPFGRRRRIPELNSPDRGIRSEAGRKAVNAPIQGASSDLVLLSGGEIRKKKYSVKEIRSILFVHDELVFYVREDLVPKYAPIVKHAMENPPLHKFGIKLDIPLKSDVSVGPNFYDCKEIKFGKNYEYLGVPA